MDFLVRLTSSYVALPLAGSSVTRGPTSRAELASPKSDALPSLTRFPVPSPFALLFCSITGENSGSDGQVGRKELRIIQRLQTR